MLDAADVGGNIDGAGDGEGPAAAAETGGAGDGDGPVEPFA